MNPHDDQPQVYRSARSWFVSLVAAFLLVFAVLEGWLVSDQFRVLNRLHSLEEQALPQAMERQRLVRNLEALRLEGDKLLFNASPEVQRQSALVLDLIVSHPSFQYNAQTRAIAGEVRALLERVQADPPDRADLDMRWQGLSQSLAQLADQITADGINMLSQDVHQMTRLLYLGERKVVLSLLLAIVAMAGLLMLIGYIFIRPLRGIDRVLQGLRGDQALLPLPATRTREIAMINDAIVKLHETLRENEANRAGLERLATTDALTGLSNRGHFMQQAAIELERSQRHQRPVTVGLADLDHFKSINDRHGHAAGDAVLKVLAGLMDSTCRKSDLFGRYGGEEFAFLFPETPPAEARLLAERLLAALGALPIVLPGGDTIHVTLSMGLVDARGLGLDAALQQADAALYAAKAAGRNRVEVAD